MSRKITYMPLAELQGDPRNPKSHDLDTIDKSIGRFGVVDAVVVDGRTGYIISGHGRVAALREMSERGEAPPEGIAEDGGQWQIPVVTGWSSRTDMEARAALIALNRTTELGGWVDDELISLLDELEENDALEGVGFDPDEIEAMAHITTTFEDVGPRDLDELYEQVGDPTEDDDERGLEPSGQFFRDLDVLVGEPKHDTPHGSVYRLGGRHLMVVAKLANEHHLWSGYLEGRSFAPYPDVYLLLGLKAKTEDFLLVQPNKYLAGHVLDKWASVHGEESIERIEQ